VDVALDRVDHDQVASLRLLDRYELASLVERRPRLRVAPHRWAEFRPRRRPHRWLRPRPAGREAHAAELAVIGRTDVLVHAVLLSGSGTSCRRGPRIGQD